MTKREQLDSIMKHEIDFHIDTSTLSPEEIQSEVKRLTKVMQLMNEVIAEQETTLAQLECDLAHFKKMTNEILNEA